MKWQIMSKRRPLTLEQKRNTVNTYHGNTCFTQHEHLNVLNKLSGWQFRKRFAVLYKVDNALLTKLHKYFFFIRQMKWNTISCLKHNFLLFTKLNRKVNWKIKASLAHNGYSSTIWIKWKMCRWVVIVPFLSISLSFFLSVALHLSVYLYIYIYLYITPPFYVKNTLFHSLPL